MCCPRPWDCPTARRRARHAILPRCRAWTAGRSGPSRRQQRPPATCSWLGSRGPRLSSQCTVWQAQARGNAAVLANSVAWTAATTEWLKVIVRRKRPVLYTGDATAAAADKENQESLPSGHASVAFAAATTYWVLARRERLPHRTRNTIFLYAGAAGVAALRVAAGKHFPTDVLAGAALGSAVGWLVPTIHPTQP